MDEVLMRSVEYFLKDISTSYNIIYIYTHEECAMPSETI